MKTVIKSMKQFVAYLLVGGGATIVEWLCFWIFSNYIGIQYLVATTLAFIASTFANWLLGRLFAFKDEAKNTNIIKEILSIYLVSVIGLGLNLVIMYVMVERFIINAMISKIMATGLVFFYNYFVRKLLIYR